MRKWNTSITVIYRECLYVGLERPRAIFTGSALVWGFHFQLSLYFLRELVPINVALSIDIRVHLVPKGIEIFLVEALFFDQSSGGMVNVSVGEGVHTQTLVQIGIVGCEGNFDEFDLRVVATGHILSQFPKGCGDRPTSPTPWCVEPYHDNLVAFVSHNAFVVLNGGNFGEEGFCGRDGSRGSCRGRSTDGTELRFELFQIGQVSAHGRDPSIVVVVVVPVVVAGGTAVIGAVAVVLLVFVQVQLLFFVCDQSHGQRWRWTCQLSDGALGGDPEGNRRRDEPPGKLGHRR